MEIKVQRLGVLPEQFMQQIKFQFITVQDGLVKLGTETRDKMRQVIQDRTTRGGGTGNLQKSIEVYKEKSSDGILVGVGKLSDMKAQAPYWYLMNYGGFSGAAKHGTVLWGSFGGSTPQPLGRFAGTGVGRQHWTPASPGQMWPMTPKSPVAAKNYIEITANWVSTVWRIHQSGFTRKKNVYS